MFKIVSSLRTWQPLRWGGIDEDGAAITNEVEAQLVLLDVDQNVALMNDAAEVLRAAVVADAGERQALFDRLHAAAAAGAFEPEVAGVQPSQSELFAAIAVRIVWDLRGLADDNDRALPFDWETLRRLMAVPGTFDALLAAYGRASRGQNAVREGN